MLGDVGRLVHLIVRWQIAVKVYDVFDVIGIPYMKHYAIHCVFSHGALATFSSSSCMSPACASSCSVSVSSPGVLLSSVGVSFSTAATVALFTDTVLRMPSSSIVTVAGET